MCCWFASSFGWFSVSWASTCLRASTATASMRRLRSTFPSMRLTTGRSAKHSFTKTLPRSGGRMSRSTLTMWAPDTWPCYKWWECHTWLLPLSDSISSSTLPLCLTNFFPPISLFPSLSWKLHLRSPNTGPFFSSHWRFFTLLSSSTFLSMNKHYFGTCISFGLSFSKICIFQNVSGILLFFSSRPIINVASLLKGYIQRVDGHNVCGCGFQRGTCTWFHILIVFVASCMTHWQLGIWKRLFQSGVYVETNSRVSKL